MRKSIFIGLRTLVLIIIAYQLFFFIRLLIIFPWTPHELVYAEEPEPADLIVVLDGESGRIDLAFELIARGYSSILFTPGIKQQKSRNKILQKLAQASPSVRFFEGRGVESTYEEALETRRFIAGQNIDSILLVTSPYHSYRAYWIFRKVLRGIRIVSTPEPLENSWFSPGAVKKENRHFEIFRKEQKKFFVYYLLYSWRLY
ncbi:MAG TPA: YdcF family protein [Desulfatiglandales bacterium]|nr:YdcF family protein [Desulfatiglandales bacterium]